MLTDREETIVMDITIASCTFSLLGALFIVVFFLAFEELRQFAHRLIFYLAIGEFFWAGSYLLGPLRDDDSLCRFQSVMISYWGLVVVLWIIAISYTLNRCLTSPTANLEDYEKKYLLGCFGLPAIVAAIPLSTGSYGETLGWCWIARGSQASAEFLWELLVFFGPLWVAFAVSIFYSFTVYKISRGLVNAGNIEGDERQERLRFLHKLKRIPLSLLACWLMGSLDRLYLLANPSSPSFTLALLHYGLGCVHGFVVAIIYLCNPLVSRIVKLSCFPYLVTAKSVELRSSLSPGRASSRVRISSSALCFMRAKSCSNCGS